ncbi:cation:proton antiporter [Planococcus lenghuensis]|uniref:Sodium:proton antiporter n=1 Tax=Planococcus lenghuensis TaxID=2213202 RepID=A0A1Q2KWP3_9BACL|nr:sodium:proton antiporter [Planococcus lenghuensis]AQQ52610.1 sodium:proton antiporter [Planococcus lenghuensis]
MSTIPIMAMLGIGYVVFMVDKKQKNFPIPVALLLVGIGLSFIPFFTQIEVTETLIYHIFIPGLLFASAYQVSVKALRENAKVIGLLSTVGLLLTVLLLGAGIYYLGNFFFPISFIESMVVAAVLAPTDPVSVVAILKQAASDEDIANIVEGESLINDGTSIVLFSVLAEMYISHNMFNFGSFAYEFAYVSIGGAALGLLVGWLLSKAVNVTHHHDYQVMLSIIIAYGAFELAEQFGFSGVLATVAAGIMLSWQFTHGIKEKDYRKSLYGFWSVLEPSLLIILFLLLGIVATEFLLYANWAIALGILLLSLVVRFLVVFGTMQLFRGLHHVVDWKKVFLISWSGIRGSMSIFLLLTLSVMVLGDTNKLLLLSYPVVFLSLVIQSVGLYPLSRRMEE